MTAGVKTGRSLGGSGAFVGLFEMQHTHMRSVA